MFDLVYPDGVIADIQLLLPGFHNVENAVAAGAAALAVGVAPDAIRAGLNSYRGVRRRFEYVLKTDRAVLIDDYAHHPEEVRAFLSSVKALYPDREITAIFQPHLFSRTRDFAAGFAESLSLADHVILLDIYPAREFTHRRRHVSADFGGNSVENEAAKHQRRTAGRCAKKPTIGTGYHRRG